ncbi:MAG: glycosyltransferase [Candidatus Eisenbacteria bacterium]
MKGTTPDRPMRVLHVIARLNVGGPAIYVSLLASRLRPPAYESAVLCGQPGPDEGDMRYYAEQCGVQPIVLPGLGRDLHPVRDVATLVGVYRHIRRWRPDIVVTHTAKAGFVGRIAARLAGVPVIIHTFHGHVFDGYFGPRATGVFLRLERFLARLSTRIVVLSESQRDDLVDRYGIAPRDKFAVLPLGLNLAPFTSSVRKNGRFRHACGIPATAPLIGIVGRLAPIKNHEMFVRAAVRIRSQHPSSRFAVIGDGECRSAIETAVRQLGLMDTFVFTGWLRDLVDVYADLDVCVLTSRNEGTPVSLLEALAAGCPVVATDVGGWRTCCSRSD